MLTNDGSSRSTSPRERDSSFEQRIVAKRRERLSGVAEPASEIEPLDTTVRTPLRAPSGVSGLEPPFLSSGRPGRGRREADLRLVALADDVALYEGMISRQLNPSTVGWAT
jgi:hypothetical protein